VASHPAAFLDQIIKTESDVSPNTAAVEAARRSLAQDRLCGTGSVVSFLGATDALPFIGQLYAAACEIVLFARSKPK
jgi:hypothetical protein